MTPSTITPEAGASPTLHIVSNEKRNHSDTTNGHPLPVGREGLKERVDGGNAVKRQHPLPIKFINNSSISKIDTSIHGLESGSPTSSTRTATTEDGNEDGITPLKLSSKSKQHLEAGQVDKASLPANNRCDHRDHGAQLQLANDIPLQQSSTIEQAHSEADDHGAWKLRGSSSLTANKLLELVHAEGSLPTQQTPSVSQDGNKVGTYTRNILDGQSEAAIERPSSTNVNLSAVSTEPTTGAGQSFAMAESKPTILPKSMIDLSTKAPSDLTATQGVLASPLPPIDEQSTTLSDDQFSAQPNSHRTVFSDKQTIMPKQLLDTSGVQPPSFANSPLSPPIRAVNSNQDRPGMSSRAMSTPVMKRKTSSNKTNGLPPLSIPPPKSARATSYVGSREVKPETRQDSKSASVEAHAATLPIPPFSLPTHLHLELSSSRPSPLYIQRHQADELPYESSQVKLERLLNFLLLPPMLEQVLLFGALACFDAWLYTFTILPLRFFKAVTILVESWFRNLLAEVSDISHFVYTGLGRVWLRRKLIAEDTETVKANGSLAPTRKTNLPTPLSSSTDRPDYFKINGRVSSSETAGRRLGHRRTKSGPSLLLPVDKADILKGLLIIISCYILMYFDASMMYHNIRGQAAIKLYVIYNALEVFDRLLSALGQDVLECLFAKETLERKPNGRSKLLRPAWLFMLALVYNIVHSLALFYQVITLNVAVNSYSNALLTLLMSNQFVEIKSTVFKKIEKENLFQMTCADIVERFQLWLMLIIIASRNIVETGGLSGLSGGIASSSSSADRGPSLLPHSFTLLPDWTGVVMGPFFLVLGTEMLVDWIKHAYINKFNATKPNVYGRFLDILAKDYYSRAFTNPDLTKRVGLATIPLSCLFIRASVQTYHMFLATHTVIPLPSTTSLEDPFASPETTPAIKAAIQHIDGLFKRAIFGADSEQVGSVLQLPWLDAISIQLPSLDTVLTYLATILIFTIFFLLLLILKILLGMFLLSYARTRYANMQQREKQTSQAEGKRFGGWGVVELGDEKRKWIYEDDPEGLKKMRDREKDTREREGRGGKGLEHVERYSMVAKRIW